MPLPMLFYIVFRLQRSCAQITGLFMAVLPKDHHDGPVYINYCCLLCRFDCLKKQPIRESLWSYFKMQSPPSCTLKCCLVVFLSTLCSDLMFCSVRKRCFQPFPPTATVPDVIINILRPLSSWLIKKPKFIRKWSTLFILLQPSQSGTLRY